jgi:hypothetical protein
MAIPVDDLIDVLSRADSLYARRAEAEAVKESVALLSESNGKAEPYEINWRLARALFFLGQEAQSKSLKCEMHRAGIESGRKATELENARVEGRFWLGVNLALFAESVGGLRAAAALVSAKKELARAAEISAEYHDAGPLRVLGKIYHKAPWFLGGSHRQSREYFDRAIAIAPSNSVTLLYAAELAIDAGERNRAISMFEKIITLPAEGDWEFEKRRDSEIARQRLEQLRNGRAGS